jgi:cell division protease FtsH
MPFQLYMSLITGIISAFVFGVMWLYIMRGGAIRSFTQLGKSYVKGKEIGIYWHDVVGMEEVKLEAKEVVNLIRDRAEIEERGSQILRGVLLLGPPGCGKTYLVKAIATETNMPFLAISGSEFVEIFVGVGASRVRKLFKQARELAALEGGCIIFIDEIDALGVARATDLGFGGGQTERNTTLNQLLVEMDGLKGKNDNIVVFGATNMTERFLDSALLRPGRFDRKIYVDLPDFDDRQKLCAYYLNKTKYSPDIKIDQLAYQTAGNSPAEIANVIHEATLISMRNKRNMILIQDINEARERISLGIKRRIKMTKTEKLRVSYHEAGHLVITYLLVPSKEIFKATIIPRGSSLGATWSSEREELLARDKDMLLGEIKICFAGYLTEKMKFGNTSTGVDSDFEKATLLAHNMSWRWGMGKSGHVGSFESGDKSPLYWGGLHADLDKDAKGIIQECMAECEEVLKKNWDIVERIASTLFAKEEIEFEEINNVFGEFGKLRPKKEEVS